MVNREKIAKGIEYCKTSLTCVGCVYAEQMRPEFHTNLECKLQDDVLELLKEQEAKQVIGIADSIEGMEVGYCPSCDRTIVNKKIDVTKFCKFCGQAVKWE